MFRRPPTPVATLSSVLLAAAPAAGQIAFEPPVSIPLPTPHVPSSLHLADLDGDQRLDLVVTGRSTDGLLYILRGAEDGSFLPPEAIELGFPTDAAASGDFNGDGHVDLVLVARTQIGRLIELPGLAGGGFGTPELVTIEREPRSLCLADFDGDGAVELAATNYGSNSITTAEIGPEGIQPFDHLTIGREAVAMCFPQETHAGDLDGDGVPELVVPAIGNGRLQIMRFAAGSLAVPNPTGIRTPAVGDQHAALTTAGLFDLDGDGDLDAITPAILLGQSQVIVIYRNDGSGNLLDRSLVETSFIGFAWCATAADFDGDGRVDLVAGMALPGMIVVRRNESTDLPGGDLVYGFPMPIFEGSFIRDLAIGDLDGDGDPDLVAVDISSHTVHVFRNRSGEGGLAGLEDPVTAGGKRSLSASPAADRDAGRGPLVDRNLDGLLDARDVAIELADWMPPAAPAAKEGSR